MKGYRRAHTPISNVLCRQTANPTATTERATKSMSSTSTPPSTTSHDDSQRLRFDFMCISRKPQMSVFDCGRELEHDHGICSNGWIDCDQPARKSIKPEKILTSRDMSCRPATLLGQIKMLILSKGNNSVSPSCVWLETGSEGEERHPRTETIRVPWPSVLSPRDVSSSQKTTTHTWPCGGSICPFP